jgi:hypothetical protein
VSGAETVLLDGAALTAGGISGGGGSLATSRSARRGPLDETLAKARRGEFGGIANRRETVAEARR